MSKKPFTYAVLKYMTTVDEASADEVMDALRADYSSNRQFRKPNVVEILMAAKENGLLEETRYEFDRNKDIRVYYKAPADGAETINSYIK